MYGDNSTTYYSESALRVVSQGDAKFKIVKRSAKVSELYMRTGPNTWKRLCKNSINDCLSVMRKWSTAPECPVASMAHPWTATSQPVQYFDVRCNSCGERESKYRLIHHGSVEWSLQVRSTDDVRFLYRGSFKACKLKMCEDAQVGTEYYDRKGTRQPGQDQAYYILHGTGGGAGSLCIYDDETESWGEPIHGRISMLRLSIVPVEEPSAKRTRNAPRSEEAEYYDANGHRLYVTTGAVFKVHRMSTGVWRFSVRGESGRFNWQNVEGTYEEMISRLHALTGHVDLYFDAKDKCDEKAALYRVHNMGNGEYRLDIKENGVWTRKAVGTYRKVLDSLDAIRAWVSGTDSALSSTLSGGVQSVMKRVRETCGMSEQELTTYLFLCMCRNRALGGSPLINTRLVDVMRQPVYILDCSPSSGTPAVSYCHVIDNLEQIKRWLPGVTVTEFPPPIQFADSPADCVWNPSMPVYPIGMGAVDHIYVDRQDRLPEELKGLDRGVCMEVIKQSLEVGAYNARIDCTYALPSYSRTRNDVGLMLPLTIPALYGPKPVAAMLLNKEATGYYLSTIITLEMARRSVRLFRDPQYTWLKEGDQ